MSMAEIATYKQLKSSPAYRSITELIENYWTFGETEHVAEINAFLQSKNVVRVKRIESDAINKLFDLGMNPGGPQPTIHKGWTQSVDISKSELTLLHEGELDL